MLLKIPKQAWKMRCTTGSHLNFLFHSCILVFCSLFFIFGDLTQKLNSDNVLHMIMFQDHWPPFYWFQNRFGLPMVWLSGVLSNAKWHLYVYYFLITFFSFLPFVLLPSILGKTHRIFWGLVFLSFLFLSTKKHIIFEYIIEPYGASLGFFFLGLYTLVPNLQIKSTRKERVFRYFFSFLFFFLTYWINIGLCVFTFFPLAVYFIYIWARQEKINFLSRTEWIFILTSILMPFLLNFVWMRTYTYPIKYTVVEINEWIPMIQQFFISILKSWGSHAWVFYFVLLIHAIFASKLLVDRKSLSKSEIWFLSFLCGSISHFLFFSVMKWTLDSGLHYRYALPSFIGLGLCSMCFVSAIREKINFKRHQKSFLKHLKYIVMSFSLVLILATQHGLPSISRSLSNLHRTLGKYTPDILKSQCTHLIGNYWDVWSSVFHVRWVTGSASILGLAWRAIDNKQKIDISLTKPTIFCSSKNDPEAQHYANDWSLGKIQSRTNVGTIDILTFQ